MDQAVISVLADYDRRQADEWLLMQSLPEAEVYARIDEFLISIGPDTGRLLHTIAIGAKAQVLVEIGASYGYSTVWLADAARATGGKLHSLELSAKKVDYARSELKRAGLERFVEFHVGDALASLVALPGPFDFVLLDLWKDLYNPCFELFHAKLAPDAFVAADNILFPPAAHASAESYRRLVRTKGDMESLLVPVGSGVELSKKRSA